MTTPIARLHAIELILAVLIADRAGSAPNGHDWLRSRRDYILRALAKVEPKFDEQGVASGLSAIHVAVSGIFEEAESISKRSPQRPGTPGKGPR